MRITVCSEADRYDMRCAVYIRVSGRQQVKGVSLDDQLRACRDYAFTTLGKKRVIALVRPENTVSEGVAKSLGMDVVGRTPHGGYEHLVFAVENPRNA